MATFGDLTEAAGILNRMLVVLLGTLTGEKGRSAASLRFAIGDLQARAVSAIADADVGQPLLTCFILSVQAGASIVDMEAVRTGMQAESPFGLPGLAIANMGVRFALGAQARILAGKTFTSSQDVLAALAQQAAAHEAAQEYAADHREPAVYQALIALQAAVTRDLTTRALSLPSLVPYRMPRILTSHALANRLYGDAGRADELRAEGKVFHPAFMPLAGTALSE